MMFILGMQRWFHILNSSNVIPHINRQWGKKHIILSKYAKKVLDCKLGIDRNFLNAIRVSTKKPTANIIQYCERLNAFPLKSQQSKVSSLSTPNGHWTGNTSQCIKARKSKKNKKHTDWKGT